jgi:hypothetical protein
MRQSLVECVIFRALQVNAPLNLSVITSNFHTMAMFAIVDIQITFVHSSENYYYLKFEYVSVSGSVL